MNGGFGKDFYRKGNSVKRSGRFSEPPDPKGPKIEKIQDRPPGLKISSEPTTKPLFFVGNSGGQD